MPRTWTPARAVAVAVGGVAGAGLRWALVDAPSPGDLPWATLAVNVGGSFLLGAVLAGEWAHPGARLLLHDGAGIGFCGGLTTFSAFSVQTVALADGGHTGTAVLYVAASVAGTLAAVVAGALTLRRVRALTLPLEEEP